MNGPVTLFFGTRRLGLFEFAPEDSHHLCRVLRHQIGDRVWALDGLGSVYEVALEEVKPRHVTGLILAEYPELNEPAAPTILLQGMIGQTKMDWLVEKATELGATEIRPLAGGPRIGPGRLKRWQRIARSAAKQCRRAHVPAIYDPADVATHLVDLPSTTLTLRLLADPSGARELPALVAGQVIVLAVGPERGFDQATRAALLADSFKPVSLGPRRLRAETAAVSLLSLVAQRRDRLPGTVAWPSPAPDASGPDIP